MLLSYWKPLAAASLVCFYLFVCLVSARAQSTGNSIVNGTVLDASGAVVSGAKVEIRNPVSGLLRSTTTDNAGNFSFANVPFNPYHLTVTMKGFAPAVQDVDVRSIVPTNLTINLTVTGSAETVTVEAAGEDLLEKTSTFHT